MSTSLRWAAIALALAIGGCAAIVRSPPQPGETEAAVVARLGPPTDRYSLPEGATRLEYATGPYGRETWMVDVDAAGKVTAAGQVLDRVHMGYVQQHAAGMTRDTLLRVLGRPGERRSGGWQGGEVWSWRYPTNDCVWFQVSIGPDGLVRDGIFDTDPRCDAPNIKDR